MNELDLKISKKMQKLLRKTMELVHKEVGDDTVGVTLILHPVVRKAEDFRLAEFQYASTLPRHHMYGAFKGISDKWDKEGSGLKDLPPHLR